MGSRRRLISLFTALSIAWTALWPLVSSAYLIASDEAVPLCHQAGMQVSPEMAPMEPMEPQGAPAPGHHKQAQQHCPLCVMAFLAAFSPPVSAPASPHLADGALATAYWAPLPAGIEVQLPQGRAPPSFLPS